jgi:hypothetical protein
VIYVWSFVLFHVVYALLCWCFLPPSEGVGCFYIDYFVFIDSFRIFLILYYIWWGTQWRSLLRHCATSRKVAGLVPVAGIGIFY